MHGFGDGQAEGRQFVVLGAGPAGLSAAFELTRLGQRPLVLEKRDKVGGLARTEQYHGFAFDMGGHRFFSKSPVVNALWREILGQDFLHRPRLSRIFYRHRFFHYPLKLGNALWNLGPLEALLIVLSYARWRLFPYPREDTFEEWVTNRFGRRLFETFFKTYTEKVWGISCRELKAEWAAQRIRNLSLPTALLSMVVKPGKTVTSLIEAFDYPRRGPGMMWQALQARIEQAGGVIRLNADVQQIFTRGGR
ncbi:MAG: FAD-dependent oxidoreductase, partial [Anaerolineae bacterium]